MIDSSGVDGEGGLEEEEVCAAVGAFVDDGYERGVIPEQNVYVREEEEGFGLSTKAGMSLQRVEGVNKDVVGCAHRRRWRIGNRSRGGARGAYVVMGETCQQDFVL